MNCLIGLLCLFHPANLYASAELLTSLSDQDKDGVRWCSDHWCHGPMAEISLGFSAPITSSLDVDLGVRHSSFTQEADRGEESAYLKLTWRPFRHE